MTTTRLTNEERRLLEKIIRDLEEQIGSSGMDVLEIQGNISELEKKHALFKLFLEIL